MSLRPIILYILMMTVIAPARSQNAAGSSIVSRTVPSSDTARVLEQRVYDNGLGDVVQEVQSCPVPPCRALPSAMTMMTTGERHAVGCPSRRLAATSSAEIRYPIMLTRGLSPCARKTLLKEFQKMN